MTLSSDMSNRHAILTSAGALAGMTFLPKLAACLVLALAATVQLKVLFAFETARMFQRVNAVQARGGSIDNAAIVAGNGYPLVSSGYGLFGQLPDTVLLAFAPQPSR